MGLRTQIEVRTKIFLSKISNRMTKKGCRLWKGRLNKKGYGHQFTWINGECLLAHRISYLIHHGDFNRKLFICHKCDNPACVNPDHLYAGTAQDNMQDMVNKGRSNKGKTYKKTLSKERYRVQFRDLKGRFIKANK